jgi:hypothetical protein
MEFTDADTLFLQTICLYFHERATWPTYDYLDLTLSDDPRDFDVERVARKLEPFMFKGTGFYTPTTRWNPEQVASLGISALYTCYKDGLSPELGEDIDAFMHLIQLCVEKFRTRAGDGQLTVTDADLRNHFELPELMIRKVYVLAAKAGLVNGGGSSLHGDDGPMTWSFNLTPDFRRYRRVKSMGEFMAICESVQDELKQTYMPAIYQPNGGAAARLQVQPISIFPEGPFTPDEHLCFVLMPFAAEFRPVYNEAIKPAATEATLECKRADDIYQPGQIMAQVWQKLMEARVVVADLTTRNPNVFYELGLAHTLGHEVILLTQNMDEVPFDLRHLRCFDYTLIL